MTQRRFWILAWAGLVLGLAGLIFAPGASAQVVWTNDCPDMPPDLVSATDDAIETREQGQRDVTICLAVTERTEYLVALQEAAIEDEATTAAQRVALAPIDRNRLDLTWWGIWATLGTVWAMVAGLLLLRAFRFWRE